MTAQAPPCISPEEYLRIEREAETKSEYHDGQMFAMSGGTLSHSKIPVRLGGMLMSQLDESGCGVSNSDLKVRISPQGPFVYPDLTIYCGEPHLADDRGDILLNPTVVFEVLSTSSEAYDRGHKFALYRRIESLKDYVLVSQSEPRIEVFSKVSDGAWTMNEFAGLDAVCKIPSVSSQVRLADVYRGISFEIA